MHDLKALDEVYSSGHSLKSSTAMPGMEHHSQAESTEKLGRVSFPISCAAGLQAGKLDLSRA